MEGHPVFASLRCQAACYFLEESLTTSSHYVAKK